MAFPVVAYYHHLLGMFKIFVTFIVTLMTFSVTLLRLINFFISVLTNAGYKGWGRGEPKLNDLAPSAGVNFK